MGLRRRPSRHLEPAPLAMGALYAGNALVRVAAASAGVAIQFDLTDLASGRPHGWIIGVVGAMQAVSEMVFAPVLARWADRLGRRRFLVGGPLVSVVGSLLLVAALHPRQIAGARLLEGVGAAAFVPAALGTIAAATAGSRMARARASGGFEISILLGYAAGAVIGPLAYHVLHRGAFVAVAALYLCAGLACLRFVPPTRPQQVSSLATVARAIVSRGPMRSFLPAWMAAYALVLAFAQNLPALLKRQAVSGQTIVHHFDDRLIASVLVAWIALFIVGIALWTPVVARWGAAVTMRRAVPGAWVICAGLVAVNHTPLRTAPPSLLLVTAGILWLAGFAPAALTYLAECTSALAADRCALMSFYTVTLAGGGALGAFLGGVAVSVGYADGLIVLGAALAGFAFAALGPVVRHARQVDRTDREVATERELVLLP